MGNRLDLHEMLCMLLGSRNVYFQPPDNITMQYPAIVYTLNDINTDYADDQPYTIKKQYSITIIDKNPDGLIPDKIGRLKTSAFRRHFTQNNLNHYVYNLYY